MSGDPQTWTGAPGWTAGGEAPGHGQAGRVHDGVTWTVGDLPLSSRWRRLAGHLLEGVLVFATLVVGWLIWWVITWKRGQTPAKSLLGMRCVRTDTGLAATRGQMAVRELVGKVLIGNATCGVTSLVSAFMILFGESRQGVWDKLTSTVVVDDPEGRFLPLDLR